MTNECKTLPNSIVIIFNLILFNIPLNYTIIYEVIDFQSNNVDTMSLQIKVVNRCEL